MKKANLIISASNADPDMMYITGFKAPDPFLFCQVENKKIIVVSVLEYERAKNEAYSDIKVYQKKDFIGSSNNKSIENLLASLTKKFGINEFVVQKNFPLYYAEYLMNVIGAGVKCVQGNYFPQRTSKNKKEIKYLEEAIGITEQSMQKAEDIIHNAKINNSGYLEWQDELLTSELIRKEINIEAIKQGAFAFNTIVASGKQSSQPHNAGSGPILAGTPIVIDIFPRVEKTMYWGDMTRTFVKGKAPRQIKKAYERVKNIKDFIKSNIKAGDIISSWHKKAFELMEDSGFHTKLDSKRKEGFFHNLGHGIGLDLHEAPSVGMGNRTKLPTNSAITIEPGLYYPEWGGIRLEDVIIVGKEKVISLTQYEDCLEIS